MKVIHIAGGGDRGGAKTHIISLCSQLTKCCEVILVSLRSGDFPDSAVAAGINTHTIFSRSTIKDYAELVKFVKKEKPDIVHCHGAKANLAGLFVKRFCKATIVTTVHSDYRLDYMHSKLKKYTFGLLNTAALRSFDYYVTVSDLFKEMLISRGFEANKIMTIYNGLDFSKSRQHTDKAEYLKVCGLEYEEGDTVIGIPARLTQVKDIPTLLRAFAKAKAQNHKLKLLIGGDGEDADKLKIMAHELGLDGSVAFLGWVSDVPSFFAACDIDVLCSISESFPYSVLEGIKEGCAVITSDVGGMRKLVDNGVNGYVFNPGDVDTFAQYILDLSLDKDKRERFALLLYRKASYLYSIDNMRDTQVGIYTNIIKLENSRKSKNGILICGAYGRGNSGDEAILKAIIDSIRADDPFIPITVMTRKPLETSIKHGVDAIFTFSLFKFLRAMKRCRIFINGGGNLIQDSTSSRSLYFYLYTIFAAKRRNCKVLMYGCGIGKVRRPINRKITRLVIDKYADVITLRDSLSKDELHQMGITTPEIKLTADPALSIKPAPISDADYYLKSNGIDADGSYICFSLREWKDFNDFSAFSKAAEYAYKKYNLVPIFLPIEVPRDLEAANAAASSLNCPHHILMPPSDASLLISVYGKMKAVCAVRLHALVFAAASGAPFMAVSYDIKVDGFMNYVERQEFCKDLTSLNCDWLCKCVDSIMTGNAPASPAPKLRELEKGNTDSVRQLLNAPL